jgi:arsenite methyltransferase
MRSSSSASNILSLYCLKLRLNAPIISTYDNIHTRESVLNRTKEIHRILKKDGGRMVISDLVTDREINKDSVDPEKWCSCIDGALTKTKYLDSIRKAGFKNIAVLEEKAYIDDQTDNDRRKISSVIIKAVKN